MNCPRHRVGIGIAFVLTAILFTPVHTVTAAPYWGQTEIERYYDGAPPAAPPSAPAPSTASRAVHDYGNEYALVASFLDTWQVTDPGLDFGGIREGEHLPDIIQTDNTSESIWVWSRYYELTGDDQYNDNIAASWAYSMNHPAYLEEGGSEALTGYYRMYNCGWAVRAERKYREIFGDESFHAYGDSCASYIANHTLSQPAAGFYHFLNPAVLSWAIGNLHQAGVAASRSDWTDRALTEGRKVKGWVEAEPTILANETWAMSGGATLWGLLESFFQERPDSVAIWVPSYAAQLDDFSTPGQFQNAWNGWYALGHRAAGLALGDVGHLATHITITDFLVAEDADTDGGIPARPEETDDMDQTWVANYLACFGLTDALDATSSVGEPMVTQRLALAPNPSSDRTTVRFRLDRPEPVTISIHDVSGRLVAVLADETMAAGSHEIVWDGQSDRGVPAPAGLYFATLKRAGERLDQRLVRLRR
ncbi:MAG: T9SS type A sorting domain-containing protein [Candidatus Eisenbacteria bacterium]|uniref:T9SS type A sorting domain-containing protein n=1 Tax=Eiseniibacteriota bacterium TaxID=2212470 RepID=A0A956RNQ8_UNCEI|nr:T9SS type A sorting domain-containing protein [Candidatus Eisenbacteria bacterium]